MAGNAWETEDRDSNGRWTSGGKGTASNQNEAGQISLKEKILDGAGRFLKSMNAATGLRSFVQSVQLAPSQLNDMAELFDLWSRADHWSASAFQGHFLSPLYNQSYADSLRQSAQRLLAASNKEDIQSAVAELGWRIGQYSPQNWVKDMGSLKERAQAALTPNGPARSLDFYKGAEHANQFEYDNSLAQIMRKQTSPAYEPQPMADHRFVQPILASKPQTLAQAPSKRGEDKAGKDEAWQTDLTQTSTPPLPRSDQGNDKQLFVDRFYGPAAKAAKKLDIPVENLLALIATESGWGGQAKGARFTREGNNYLGIHYAGSKENTNAYIQATNSPARVKKFNSYEDCLEYFVKNYDSLIHGQKDPGKMAKSLQKEAEFGIDNGKPVPNYASDITGTAHHMPKPGEKRK